MVPARYNFLYSPQGRPCGRPPAAAVLAPAAPRLLLGKNLGRLARSGAYSDRRHDRDGGALAAFPAVAAQMAELHFLVADPLAGRPCARMPPCWSSHKWQTSSNRVMIATGPGATVPSTQRTGLPEPARSSRQRRNWQMTEDSGYRSARRAEEPSGTAVGFILFAAIMMIMAGVFQALQGLVGHLRERVLCGHPQLHLPVRRHHLGLDPSAARAWSWPSPAGGCSRAGPGRARWRSSWPCSAPSPTSCSSPTTRSGRCSSSPWTSS